MVSRRRGTLTLVGEESPLNWWPVGKKRPLTLLVSGKKKLLYADCYMHVNVSLVICKQTEFYQEFFHFSQRTIKKVKIFEYYDV